MCRPSHDPRCTRRAWRRRARVPRQELVGSPLVGSLLQRICERLIRSRVLYSHQICVRSWRGAPAPGTGRASACAPGMASAVSHGAARRAPHHGIADRLRAPPRTADFVYGGYRAPPVPCAAAHVPRRARRGIPWCARRGGASGSERETRAGRQCCVMGVRAVLYDVGVLMLQCTRWAAT
jgi:hypothetical protein